MSESTPMYNAIETKFKRVGHIEIIEAKKQNDELLQKQLFVSDSGATGLDFKFSWDINESDVQGVRGNGSVGVLGLQGETIRSLIEYGTQEAAQEKGRYAVVYAGYDSDPNANKEPLFVMPIYGATITQPPEMWLNVVSYTGAQDQLSALVDSTETGSNTKSQRREALERRRKQDIQELMNPESKDLKTFVQKMCSEYGILLNWTVSDSDYSKIPQMDWPTDNFTNISDVVRYLNTLGWIHCYIDDTESHNGTVNVFGGAISFGKEIRSQLNVIFNGRFAYRAEINQQKIEWDRKKKDADKRDPINMSTGMVGFPKFGNMEGQIQMTVKTLLRKDIKAGDFIVVESDFINIPKGTYYRVTGIKYEGQFRGQQWYTTYTAMKTDRPVDKYSGK